MKKRALVIASVLIVLTAAGFTAFDNVYLKINQNIDIFGRVYKEIVSNYVDEVDPERFMRSGIEGMLETLDPYTVYLAGKDEEDIDLLTHGQYGGVGISIGVRDGVITVLSPTEGYSAYKQGIKAGDQIIEVDGFTVTGVQPDSVRLKVRGESGTTVKMKIVREGEPQPIEFTLVREQIQVHNVSYFGYIEPTIGYIKLDRFSRRAGEEVRQAIKELKVKGNLRGVVLDLRDNPGGLLEAAVETVEIFGPKGSTIVTTKGRKGAEERTYRVEGEPIASTIPLAVLVNKNSASASEIVAGAVQDLDRGIIVGTRSFGKGLVQTVVPLNYNSSIKITTARYYTPSGRSIQEIDYLRKNKDGIFAVTPDSLKREFRTSNGRAVKELGGISPDTTVEEAERSAYHAELMRKAIFFKFATTYVANRAAPEQEYRVTDDAIKEFERYIERQRFEFVEPAEKSLAELKERMKKEKYSAASITSADALQAMIHAEKSNTFVRYREELRNELSEEINSRFFGEKGRIRSSLGHDAQVRTAASILLDPTAYRRLLLPKK